MQINWNSEIKNRKKGLKINLKRIIKIQKFEWEIWDIWNKNKNVRKSQM